MLVNLYVDHMMSAPPTSSDDILAATRDHSTLFAAAAGRIGLTPAEYREFRNSLLDGNVMFVRLPHRVDAMSAAHRGNVYAVKNAVVTQNVMSWRVALSDGNVVYVPQICGNLSLVRHAAVAAAPPKPRAVAAVHHARFVPALGTYFPAAAAPVAAVPAAVPVAPVIVAAAPAAVAAAPVVAPAASANVSPFFFGIPAVIGGILAGVTHHDTTAAPPCSQGSNLTNACQK